MAEIRKRHTELNEEPGTSAGNENDHVSITTTTNNNNNTVNNLKRARIGRFVDGRKFFNMCHNLRRFKGRNLFPPVKNSCLTHSQTLCFMCNSYFVRPLHRSQFLKEDLDSEDDKHVDLSKTIPSGTNKMPHILETALNGLSDRWRNWTIRVISSILLVATFLLIIYGGPLALMIATLAVQVKCFEEIINIGYAVYRIHGLPWFRSLSWYFLITSNYFFYGESLVDYFGVVINQTDYLRILVSYHRFISFCLYIVGFVWFVLSLVHKYYMKQFSLFAWTHVALLIVVTQSYLIIQNIFEGLIWFIVPVTMIIINDVWAYVFGFFFGRTPLIKVSPKKTWEGFIGGGIATIIFGALVSSILCRYSFFICPIEYNEPVGRMTMDCEPSYLFLPQEYALPSSLGSIMALLGMRKTITVHPFVLHSFSMSVFSSVIGPFGGFFASGFKRAFKIKDFGDVIPGHGGIMDRFDCQFLMATFVNVYISSFIRSPSPQKLLQQVFTLKPEQQLQLFYSLREALENRGILAVNSQA